jgi:hypothetical protein
MSNESLLNYYKTNFAMVQHHKYSLTELEEMIPFERDIYITLLGEFIKEENQRQREQQARLKSRRK